MNAFELKGLTKDYGGFRLDGLDLALPSGCIMGLIGENGAGKSTTIRLMLGMIKRDGGSVTLLGRDPDKDIRLVKEDIGVVFDEVGIPECLTAVQVGNIMRSIYKNWDANEYSRLLSRLSVPTDKPYKDFSRGMKMKLGISVAMSHKAKLLLLDEATSGLDPVARDEVMEMLYDFTRSADHSVLISSHIVSDLEKVCDYIAFLHGGRLLLSEEKDRLLEEYGIVHCTEEQYGMLDGSAVISKRRTPYGIDAAVRRSGVPGGITVSPISIEELFVLTVRGEDAR